MNDKILPWAKFVRPITNANDKTFALKLGYSNSSTRQSSFDLWLFLRTWPHTQQAFWKHHCQAGHLLLERPEHRERAVLFGNSVWVLERPTFICEQGL